MTDQSDSSIEELLRKINDECFAVQKNIQDAECEVLRKEDEAFLLEEADNDVLIMQKRQEQELLAKKEAFQTMMDARRKRKGSKDVLRKMSRDTKLRDMRIMAQLSARKLVDEAREVMTSKTKSFDRTMIHTEKKHQQQQKYLVASQDRRIELQKEFLELEIARAKSDERKANLRKKFEEHLSYQKNMDKKTLDNQIELQQMEIKHLKETFELECALADEMQNLKVHHLNQLNDVDTKRFQELGSEKQKLSTLKNDAKRIQLETQHQAELKKLANKHKMAQRKMKEAHNDRISSVSNSKAASVSGTTAASKIGSKAGSTLGSRKGSFSNFGSASNQAVSARTITGIVDVFDAKNDMIEDANESLALMEKISQQERVLEEITTKYSEMQSQLLISQKEEIETKERQSIERMREMQADHEKELLNLQKTQELEIMELNTVFQKEMQMQQEIHDSEYKALMEKRIMNTLLENVVDAIINIDTKGIILKFNKAAENMFGWKASETIGIYTSDTRIEPAGRNIKMLVSDDHAINHDMYIQRYLTTGVKHVIGGRRALYAKKKDGSLFPVYLSLSEVKQEGTHLFTGIVRDLTEDYKNKERKQQEDLKHQADLEKTIHELDKYKAHADSLIRNILPESVATALMAHKEIDPIRYESSTVMFVDIVGFSTLAAKCTPDQVIDLLNLVFSGIDKIITKYDAYKVETVGDTYMIVSGVPNVNGDEHAVIIAEMSLEIISFIYKLKVDYLEGANIQVRVGINTGPVVAGVVGLKMPRYCLFGDAVNTASRMESNGAPMKIHISESTFQALEKQEGFKLTYRGQIKVKGKGEMKTYWLTGKEGFPYELPAMQ